MSVVGNDYDELKRFNLAELYSQSLSKPKAALFQSTKPESVTTDDA